MNDYSIEQEASRFRQLLLHLGFDPSLACDASAYEWIWEDESARAILEWFCDNVDEENLLSDKEQKLLSTSENITNKNSIRREAEDHDDDDDEMELENYLETLRFSFMQLNNHRLCLNSSYSDEDKKIKELEAYVKLLKNQLNDEMLQVSSAGQKVDDELIQLQEIASIDLDNNIQCDSLFAANIDLATYLESERDFDEVLNMCKEAIYDEISPKISKTAPFSEDDNEQNMHKHDCQKIHRLQCDQLKKSTNRYLNCEIQCLKKEGDFLYHQEFLKGLQRQNSFLKESSSLSQSNSLADCKSQSQRRLETIKMDVIKREIESVLALQIIPILEKISPVLNTDLILNDCTRSHYILKTQKEQLYHLESFLRRQKSRRSMATLLIRLEEKSFSNKLAFLKQLSEQLENRGKLSNQRKKVLQDLKYFEYVPSKTEKGTELSLLQIAKQKEETETKLAAINGNSDLKEKISALCKDLESQSSDLIHKTGYGRSSRQVHLGPYALIQNFRALSKSIDEVEKKIGNFLQVENTFENKDEEEWEIIANQLFIFFHLRPDSIPYLFESLTDRNNVVNFYQ